MRCKMLCTMGENELINTLVKGDSLFENYDPQIAEFGGINKEFPCAWKQNHTIDMLH